MILKLPEISNYYGEFTIIFFKDAKNSLYKKGLATHLIKIVGYIIENVKIANLIHASFLI